LKSLNLEISEDKTVVPTKKAVCLGIEFDTYRGNISIPKSKLKEVINQCKRFLNKSKITKNQIQSLLGSLLFLHKAIKPARAFVNRIIALLKTAPDRGHVKISLDMKKDLNWFVACARQANGTITMDKSLQPGVDLYVDASLGGLGAIWENNVYALDIKGLFPGKIIAHLEAINVLLAVRTWFSEFRGRVVNIHCDNMVAVQILASGRGADTYINTISRNLWLLTAKGDISLQFHHIEGKKNILADLLSRFGQIYNPIAVLYKELNDSPVWINPQIADLLLDESI
jgi:hypothetical protein